jgi:hypothetical protein
MAGLTVGTLAFTLADSVIWITALSVSAHNIGAETDAGTIAARQPGGAPVDAARGRAFSGDAVVAGFTEVSRLVY